jgi:hypothetical protein
MSRCMHEKLGKIHAKSAENRHLVQKITVPNIC